MVIIVGAGMAGLCCANYLNNKNIDFLVLDAAKEVGGRVRTDLEDGFRLDRGFQILLTAYPEAQRLLNYDTLSLMPFDSGAIIRNDERFEQFSNPFKNPSAVFSSITSPIGSFSDKLRTLRLVLDTEGITEEVLTQNEESTDHFLRNYGFSDKMMTQFLKPFFGGVFLEDQLATSSAFFKYIFGKFYEGDAVIPANGMQAIPEQLAANLPNHSIRLNCPVERINGTSVYLSSGEKIQGSQVVIATDALQANKLLRQETHHQFNATSCVYFAANESPLQDKMLVLNPNRNELIQNLCVPSDIAPNYAPTGKSLISVSTAYLGATNEQQNIATLKQELTHWFGKDVTEWQHLKSYHIPYALPSFAVGAKNLPLQVADKIYRCGDYTAYPSLNAAMMTGRKVAEMIA